MPIRLVILHMTVTHLKYDVVAEILYEKLTCNFQATHCHTNSPSVSSVSNVCSSSSHVLSASSLYIIVFVSFLEGDVPCPS